MKEALTLALDALEECRRDPRLKYEHPAYDKTITAIKEALAQPEQDNTYGYASRLATAIWQKHYMKDAPKWKPLNTTEGVLTQIDNMTCGLVKEKQAQPEQEPVAIVDSTISGHIDWLCTFFPKQGTKLYTTPPQRTWVGLTDEERTGYMLGFGINNEVVRSIEAKLKEKNT
jgi:hypothetical protein